MLSIFLNFILVLFFVTPIVACGQCNITEENYSSAGGSEQETTLTLSGNNKFNLQHEVWQPGNHENRKITKVDGRWSCENNLITLELKSEKVTAKKITVGKNPLGLDENTIALKFKTVSNDSLLANEILYLN